MITSEAIAAYGTFDDRVDSYDDKLELDIFVPFLQSHFPTYSIVGKPEGKCGVDVGVYDAEGRRAASFDLERCKAWTDDWPAYWKSLSFVGRKDKFLPLRNFHIVWWNSALTKCAIARGTDVIRYPRSTRTFKGKSQTDTVRRVPFSVSTFIGTDFRTRELQHFATRISYDFSK